MAQIKAAQAKKILEAAHIDPEDFKKEVTGIQAAEFYVDKHVSMRDQLYHPDKGLTEQPGKFQEWQQARDELKRHPAAALWWALKNKKARKTTVTKQVQEVKEASEAKLEHVVTQFMWNGYENQFRERFKGTYLALRMNSIPGERVRTLQNLFEKDWYAQGITKINQERAAQRIAELREEQATNQADKKASLVELSHYKRTTGIIEELKTAVNKAKTPKQVLEAAQQARKTIQGILIQEAPELERIVESYNTRTNEYEEKYAHYRLSRREVTHALETLGKYRNQLRTSTDLLKTTRNNLENKALGVNEANNEKQLIARLETEEERETYSRYSQEITRIAKEEFSGEQLAINTKRNQLRNKSRTYGTLKQLIEAKKTRSRRIKQHADEITVVRREPKRDERRLERIRQTDPQAATMLEAIEELADKKREAYSKKPSGQSENYKGFMKEIRAHLGPRYREMYHSVSKAVNAVSPIRLAIEATEGNKRFNEERRKVLLRRLDNVIELSNEFKKKSTYYEHKRKGEQLEQEVEAYQELNHEELLSPESMVKELKEAYEAFRPAHHGLHEITVEGRVNPVRLVYIDEELRVHALNLDGSEETLSEEDLEKTGMRASALLGNIKPIKEYVADRNPAHVIGDAKQVRIRDEVFNKHMLVEARMDKYVVLEGNVQHLVTREENPRGEMYRIDGNIVQGPVKELEQLY